MRLSRQANLRLTLRRHGNTFLYMAKLNSRVRTSDVGRTYRGEAEARFLASQLNEGRKIDRESLRQVISALQKLADCRPQPIKSQRVLSDDPTQIDEVANIEAVNKVLRRYEAWPHLKLPLQIGGPIRLEWRSTAQRNSEAIQRRIDANLELRSVLIAVGLAVQGRIGALKECANPDCKRWLFARFKHQRFCATACYELFHETDPGDKKRRREWARNNYRSRKELELGSRKAAQRKGGKR
jgi:hypothetical protein